MLTMSFETGSLPSLTCSRTDSGVEPAESSVCLGGADSDSVATHSPYAGAGQSCVS